MDTTVTTPAPAAPPAPSAANHARLDKLLGILERLGIIALTIAPTVAAPFVGGRAGAIIAGEQPAANELASVLAAELNPPTA